MFFHKKEKETPQKVKRSNVVIWRLTSNGVLLLHFPGYIVSDYVWKYEHRAEVEVEENIASSMQYMNWTYISEPHVRKLLEPYKIKNNPYICLASEDHQSILPIRYNIPTDFGELFCDKGCWHKVESLSKTQIKDILKYHRKVNKNIEYVKT